MKASKILLAFIFIFCISFVNAQTINQEKSVAKFKTTGGGFFKVKGTFTGMQGKFKFNSNDLDNSSFNICIDAATINTKNKKRDDHLRDPDFFEVDKYPTICFESISISKTNDTYVTKGTLTMHGISKEIDIPFEFKNNTFTGMLTINRFDYKIGEDIGTFKVAQEAILTIICVVE